MNRTAIRWIIIAASILLLGLVAIQVIWVKKAYDIEQRQFTYSVTESLKDVVRQIQQNSSDSIPIYDPVEQPSPNYFRVRIHDTLHPFYLESLLKNAFKQNEINIAFEYSIYDCFNDSVVYQDTVFLESASIGNSSTSPDYVWNNDDGHYFSVFFPERDKDIFAKMEFWVYSSFMILIVIAFFAYIISVILKQRRLSEIKTDFINNMTHEFKTPISTIALSSEVIMKPGIEHKPERLHNYATIIRNENARLQSQVERILQIATIEKENIKMKSGEVALNSIIQKSVNTFELNAKAKGGRIQLSILAEHDLIKGDEMHLTNIMSNLIDNAIKYSESAPNIEVSTRNEGRNIIVIVEDNGIGIALPDQSQVFDKFYRVPKGNIHDVKGFGIGLHYVKVMVEQHGGTIRLKSEPGKGSTFTLTIPLKNGEKRR